VQENADVECGTLTHGGIGALSVVLRAKITGWYARAWINDEMGSYFIGDIRNG